MKRCSGRRSRFLIAWTNLPDLEERRSRLSHHKASWSSSSPPLAGIRIDSPPKPERPSVIGWDALNGPPNCLDPAYPTKNGFPFPPEVILGGFLFGDEPPRTDVNDYAATTLYTSCHTQNGSGG